MPVRKLPCPTGGADSFDKPAEYQLKVQVPNSFGGVSEVEGNWKKVARSYCNLKTGNGTEVYRARQVDSDTDAVITMPWNAKTGDYTASGRFVVKGKTYNILFAVNENEDNIKMIFGCRRSV